VAVTCLDENLVLLLIDGGLRKWTRRAVERHLTTCDGCRELVAELLRVENAVLALCGAGKSPAPENA